jgi:predicted PurR-regulated permease PerM
MGKDPAPGSLWDWRRNFFIVWTLLGGVGLLYVAGSTLRLVGTALLLFTIAAILAFIIHPLVTFLEQRGRLPRTLAAALVFLILALAVVASIVIAGVVLVNQVTDAVRQLPAFYRAIQEQIQELAPEIVERLRSIGIEADVFAWQEWAFTSFGRLDLLSSEIASRGLAWLAFLTDSLVNATVVLFIAFYLVIDAQRLAHLTLRLAPDRWKPYVLFVEKALLQVAGGYVRGQLIMASMMGVGVFLICIVLGVQFSLLLAAVGFVFQMVPLIGPMFVSVALIAVALLDSTQLAAFAFAAYFVLQFVGTNVFGPRITGHAVGIHPIAAVLGLIAGAHLFGLWGALLAVPVLGFVFVTIAAIYHEVAGRAPELVEADTNQGQTIVRLARPPAPPFPTADGSPGSVTAAAGSQEQ